MGEQTPCEHELEYHACCDSVVCKKCLRVWPQQVTVYPYVPQPAPYPAYPWTYPIIYGVSGTTAGPITEGRIG